MKKHLLTIVFFVLIFHLNGNCQEDYFSLGNKFFQQGNFRMADSMFTLDIYKRSSPDCYFNRGVARLYLKDTTGFCSDMENADLIYSDKEAVLHYNRFCCKQVDTVYYDKKYKKTIKGKHRFFEVVKDLKYSNQIYGEAHNIYSIYTKVSADGSSSTFNLNEIETDIYATFFLKDSSRIYYSTITPPKTLGYDDLKLSKELIDKSISAKYNSFIVKNKLTSVRLFYSYIVNTSGTIENISFLGNDKNIDISEINDVLKKDVEMGLEKIKYKPGSFRGEVASFYKTIFFELN
ncbi:MAG: hypothetical protein NTY07_01950 [Bacteroidia bacterium]|nr:hypothetical protein [Bacteroidia bacterium]